MDNYTDPLRTVRHTLGTYLVDLSISETEQSQNSISSRLYLWPVLLHRYQGNAHDCQLHSLQLPPMHPWFLLDQPETYYYPVHQHDPEDWIRVVVIDFYVLFLLCHHPPRFDFENWHVLEWLFYNFIYSVFPPILNLMFTSISSALQ